MDPYLSGGFPVQVIVYHVIVSLADQSGVGIEIVALNRCC